MSKLRSFLSSLNTNLRGKSISSKIIVIESDDWGSIRMPGTSEYDVLLNAGIPVAKSFYCKYDKIESNEDVLALLDVLSSVKSSNGQHPILTANFVVANPDFELIKENKFSKYYYEPINKTYNNLLGHEKVLDFVSQGYKEGLIVPQFHGRDHVNVPLWIELLKSNKDFKLAFDLRMWGLSRDVFPKMEKSIQATYDSIDLDYCNESLITGLDMFEQIFGNKSTTFISNNFIWDSKLEETLFAKGVKHIQSMKYQLEPRIVGIPQIKKRIMLGQTNKFGMTFGVRNCSFEPTVGLDTVDGTLGQIRNAFLFGKPAIISTHRINFSGGMSTQNRDDNLMKLKSLLKAIVKKWPDVYFKSSDNLSQILTD